MPLNGDRLIVTCANDGDVRLAELTVDGMCKSTIKLAHHEGGAYKVVIQLEFENFKNTHSYLSRSWLWNSILLTHFYFVEEIVSFMK